MTLANAEECGARPGTGAQYHVMFSESPVGMYRNLPEGRFLEVNPAFASLLGYESPEALCMDLRDPEHQLYKHPELRSKYCALLERTTFVKGLEFEARRQDGKEIWLRVNARSHRDGDGNVLYYHGCAEDISDQKAVEASLRLAQDSLTSSLRELERSSGELEACNELVGSALQRSLRDIGASLSSVLEPWAERLGQDARAVVQRALGGVTRMQLLLDDLLTYCTLGRSLPAQWALTDCNALVYQALQSLQVPLEEADAVVSSTRLPAVKGITAQLSLLFRNLIAQAAHFRGADGLQISISASRRGRFWLFEVRDNRHRQTALDPQRVFLPFRSRENDDSLHGTGLELAICKKIVESHGGEIWMVNEASTVGSAFRFSLPVSELEPVERS